MLRALAFIKKKKKKKVRYKGIRILSTQIPYNVISYRTNPKLWTIPNAYSTYLKQYTVDSRYLFAYLE